MEMKRLRSEPLHRAEQSLTRLVLWGRLNPDGLFHTGDGLTHFLDQQLWKRFWTQRVLKVLTVSFQFTLHHVTFCFIASLLIKKKHKLLMPNPPHFIAVLNTWAQVSISPMHLMSVWNVKKNPV